MGVNAKNLFLFVIFNKQEEFSQKTAEIVTKLKTTAVKMVLQQLNNLFILYSFVLFL